MGGYTTGRKEIIEMLRQRSRPYLFSNSLAPEIVCGPLQFSGYDFTIGSVSLSRYSV